ncbi:MAG: hypothetical protein FWF59_10430 [Turicibacter sp.]|nr:hypothetical protein [Turicibacter sp.]
MMKDCKCITNVPFNFSIRRGFTWFRPFNPPMSPGVPKPVSEGPICQPQACEPEQCQLVYSQEDVTTTCEEYMVYQVVCSDSRCFCPGNYYKVGDYIYKWDDSWQDWVCVDQVDDGETC